MILKKINRRISAIEERNKNVEINKRWETSMTRKITIMFFTYTTLGTYMHLTGTENPWINALIPTGGFYLSTLTLPVVRKYWEKNIK